MTHADDAIENFNKGFTCSSAAFSAFSGDFGLDNATARKIATGFGAGISRSGNMCGAVSGAIMLIGLAYGKSVQGDDAATQTTRALTRQFMMEFTAKNGSVNCTELLGYNLDLQDECDAAAQAKLFTTKCPAYVRDAAEILERIL